MIHARRPGGASVSAVAATPISAAMVGRFGEVLDELVLVLDGQPVSQREGDGQAGEDDHRQQGQLPRLGEEPAVRCPDAAVLDEHAVAGLVGAEENLDVIVGRDVVDGEGGVEVNGEIDRRHPRAGAAHER